MSVVRTVGITIQRHGPTIMTVAGVVGVVGGTVLACKATLKAETIVENMKADSEAIETSIYRDEQEKGQALTKMYISYGRQLAKAYGPSVLIIGMSVSSILYGHKIMCVRNFVLAGAYKTLTMDFDAYRERVQEKIGYDEEVNIRHNVQRRDLPNDPETGEEQYVEYILSNDPAAWNSRSKFFCESSIYWTKDPEKNLEFLLEVQKDMQKLFDKKGYLFLNSVYKALDIPETYAGSVCGWVKGYGDDTIDFGLYNTDHERIRRFVNGLEPVVLLDFNDDGYIIDKI